MGQRLNKATGKRLYSGMNPKTRARLQRAFNRFTFDEERSKADKPYRARKEHEILQLGKRLGI